MGLLFDDRGNRMSPSHANKKGVRYRYYVSQALLQNRKTEAGAVARVAAPEIEDLVVAAVRHQVDQIKRQADLDRAPSSAPMELSDRDLVALHVERIVLRARHVDVIGQGRRFGTSAERGDGWRTMVAGQKVRASRTTSLESRSSCTCRGRRRAPLRERASPGRRRLRPTSIRRPSRRC